MSATARPNSALGVTSLPDAPPTSQRRPDRIATDFSAGRARRPVSVLEYASFHEQGYLIVRGLVGADEVA
jgi:hypothetical protein